MVNCYCSTFIDSFVAVLQNSLQEVTTRQLIRKLNNNLMNVRALVYFDIPIQIHAEND